MIQDISPNILDQKYQNRSPQPGDTVFVFKDRSVLCENGWEGDADPTRFPTVSEFPDRKPELRYLFHVNEQYCFLLLPEGGSDETPAEFGPYTFVPLLYLKSLDDVTPAFAVYTAFHLNTWYSKSRFCGRCGARTLHDEKERMLRCPACGNMIFPMIAPAVIVGVRWGDKILMTKYAGREYGGWALIAGFCEIGESVEDTVRREVMEEAGLHVTNLQYVASQPWGSDSNLLMGFFCDVDGDVHIHMDEFELARAQWVDRADVPNEKELDDNLSLTSHLMQMFKKGEA